MVTTSPDLDPDALADALLTALTVIKGQARLASRSARGGVESAALSARLAAIDGRVDAAAALVDRLRRAAWTRPIRGRRPPGA